MKHRHKHQRNAARLVTLTGLVTGVALTGGYELPEASANDDKVFAPQFCKAIESDDTLDAGEAEYHENRVQAGESDGQLFICPLVRDVIKGDLETVWVRLDNHKKDENPTECCVIAYDPLGEDSEEECEEANESKGRQTLEIDGPDAEDNGYYVLTCELRDDEEGILSYRSSEENPKNN